MPDLGKYLNRRPTYTLTRRTTDIEESGSSSSDDSPAASKAPTRRTAQRTTTGATLSTISSNVNDNFYAVLPHGVALPNWSEEDKLELNDHVRHMLHSKRSRFKRSMKGFGQYVKKRECLLKMEGTNVNEPQLLDYSSPFTPHLSPSSVWHGSFS